MTNVDYPWGDIERFFAARTDVNAALRVYIESRGLPVAEHEFFTVVYDKELTKKSHGQRDTRILSSAMSDLTALWNCGARQHAR